LHWNYRSYTSTSSLAGIPSFFTGALPPCRD